MSGWSRQRALRWAALGMARVAHELIVMGTVSRLQNRSCKDDSRRRPDTKWLISLRIWMTQPRAMHYWPAQAEVNVIKLLIAASFEEVPSQRRRNRFSGLIKLSNHSLCDCRACRLSAANGLSHKLNPHRNCAVGSWPGAIGGVHKWRWVLFETCQEQMEAGAPMPRYIGCYWMNESRNRKARAGVWQCPRTKLPLLKNIPVVHIDVPETLPIPKSLTLL